MEDKEKATPVTPDEIEDIRVTLELQTGTGRTATCTPPCTLVRRPFSSIVIKSRRTVDSEASSAVISSCIVALPSASIMDSILENRSSASICLTPLFSFSFTIFQNRSFDGSYYSYIFCHRQSLSVKIIHKNRTGILCIMSCY